MTEMTAICSISENLTVLGQSVLSLGQWSTYLLPMHALAPPEKGMNASLL